SSRRRHTRFDCDWSSDVCSSDLRLEQIAIRHEAKPLIPRIVARRKMRRDIVIGTERHLHALEDQVLDLGRLAPAELEEKHSPQRSEERRVGKECRSRWST